MGRLLLLGRLAVRDLRRHRTEAALLLVAILAATTTLTLALVLRDSAADPYRSTRAATRGPDVVAMAGRPDQLAALQSQAGVVDHSGPFPVAAATLTAGGRTSDVQAIGRDSPAAPVDQPRLTQGRWEGVVVEAAFASAFRMHVGDPITLNGRSFRVGGVAVTAAMAPYPGSTCLVPSGCLHGAVPDGQPLPPGVLKNPGLVWLPTADVRSLGGGHLTYVLNLKLADPAQAPAFAAGGLFREPWQDILADTTKVAGDSRILLLIGAWLLGLLAVASLSVLVGGRMADQTRRVGLLKAVGGTPGLVAAVLLAEYLLVALVAAAGGLALGTLAAPWLTESSAGLLGRARPPSMTLTTAVVVTAVALAVAIAATAVPALRAARASTVDALADAPRAPRRVGWLIAVSARLPVPLLLALRVAGRRPRRAVLGVLSIAVTVSGVYVLEVLDTYLTSHPLVGGYGPDQIQVLRHVLLLWTVVLLVLAAVNAVVITWATVLDSRHSSALSRALGATPGEVAAALGAAQVLPALIGAVLGIFPGGLGLFAAIIAINGGDRHRATLPSLGQLVVLVVGTVLVVGALTAVPARFGGRRPVSPSLESEPA